VAATDIHHTIETVFRIERARLIAGLTRLVRDVGLAEELAQDALVTALSEWPKNGVPANPGAWLMAAAKRRAIDARRRDRMLARKHAEIGRDLADERDTSAEDIETLPETIVRRRCAALIPCARNAHTHSDQQVAQIAASIREFGFTNPVLIDEEDGIIAGHCRVLAPHLLGVDEVPCIVGRGDHSDDRPECQLFGSASVPRKDH
jgi:DNA-directed RNA polymerase specialized sigma24 family protein